MPKYHYLQTVPAVWVALVLFTLLILTYLAAHWFRRYQAGRRPEMEKSDIATINSLFLGLLGLMLAFSFSMSNDRYNTRRTLIVEEANDIGTTILRTNLLPDSVRSVLRDLLKAYVEERILFYEAGMDFGAAAQHYRRADSLSTQAWRAVADLALKNGEVVRTSEIVSALNAMIDITTTRRAAGEATLPPSILYFLFMLCLSAAFFLGYDSKGPIHWVVVVAFAFMLAATVFTIIDLDRPRSGLINMGAAHQRMVDLRAMF